LGWCPASAEVAKKRVGGDGYLGGLGVPGASRGALDVHAMAAGIVELCQLHELEHLQPKALPFRFSVEMNSVRDRSVNGIGCHAVVG
jgi:hypothetical protein